MERHSTLYSIKEHGATMRAKFISRFTYTAHTPFSWFLSCLTKPWPFQDTAQTPKVNCTVTREHERSSSDFANIFLSNEKSNIAKVASSKNASVKGESSQGTLWGNLSAYTVHNVIEIINLHVSKAFRIIYSNQLVFGKFLHCSKYFRLASFLLQDAVTQ